MNDAQRFPPRIQIYGNARIDSSRCGNLPARKVAGKRECEQAARDEQRCIRIEADSDAADDQSEDDCDVGPGFDQRIAADQLARFELLRQVCVLYRAEHR